MVKIYVDCLDPAGIFAVDLHDGYWNTGLALFNDVNANRNERDSLNMEMEMYLEFSAASQYRIHHSLILFYFIIFLAEFNVLKQNTIYLS